MLRINNKFIGEVQDIASDGRAIIRHAEGQVFFCPGLWLGEEAEVQVLEFKGRYGLARVVKLLRASPQRREAPCAYHGHSASHCGGCPWQFVHYEEQVRLKQERVEKAFAKLTHPTCIKPLISAPRELAYRSRAQFKSDGQQLGFVAAASNTLVDIETCLALSEHNQNTLKALRAELPCKDWQVNSRNRKALPWVTLDIDETASAAEVSVNKRLPFSQANSAQNAQMKAWLQKNIESLNRKSPLTELFCGSGNFTETLAALGFENILAVEATEESLQGLVKKQLPGVSTLCYNLFDEKAADRLRQAQAGTEILVLDPPREGMKNIGDLFHKKHCIRNVFYISCDLATQVRDLNVLLEKGFKVKEVQAVDQFPQTAHLEVLVWLSR